ncbi:nucleotidyltransferase family protein [Larkinella sp. VNQ87]|uniref:nucleotidyltransferase family protein n=1 Tax=Larkinella sp. VNQ87 TaxID=3400921 RepID=UPI003C0AB59D
MYAFLKPYGQILHELCKKHRVEKLYVFGSVTNETFNEESDIDFLVEFPDQMAPEQKGETYFNLLFDLEDHLKRRIDLLPNQSFKNTYFAASVHKSKTLIYAA